VWIASQTTIPQLVTIADAGSNNLWVQSAAANIPPTLMGFPVLFHERSVALGTEGDLILADLGYYMIKDGSGPFVQASPHFYFTSNKTVIKIFWNVDGAPWLDEPIPLQGSTSNTVSPFVILS
jgi:HK97 family phage major capsid protein